MPPSNRLWGMQAVEVYASTTSVRAGEAISFHVSVADASRAEPVHLGYAVLATADLTEAPQQWVDQLGHATLGYLRHGAGIVMAAAT